MSVETNNIEKISIPNTFPSGEGVNNKKVAAIKSNPMPNDKVELSAKKELSNGAKVGVGIGIVSVLALGTELIWGKGKHLKSLWEKIRGKKPTKKPDSGEKPKTTGENIIPTVTEFKNLNDAKEYFSGIGINTIFKSGSERHLSDLNTIKNDLVILEKNGVALPKPESIIINDWHNEDELKQIMLSLNIKKENADYCHNATWAWGTVERGTDNKCYVFINSSFDGNYGRFIHEMGHIHQDYLRTSYWHSKGLSDKEFLEKQMEVLGLSDIGLHEDGINMIIRDFENQHNPCTPSILRGYDGSIATNRVKDKFRQMFPDISNESDYEKLFTIFGKDGKTYVINAKKMVDRMASESRVYAPSKAWENTAEIFQGLNKGEEYSDLVMLMYDICGGGRVPNLIIKGKKYDEYIELLYNNQDLIRQLRECIEVKELV